MSVLIRSAHGLTLAALALAAIACGPATDDGPPAAAESAASSTLVSYEMRGFENEGGACGSADEPAPCVRVAIRWPELTAPPATAGAVNEAIQQWLRRATFEEGGGSPEEIFEELETARDDLRAEFPDYAVPWHLERSVTVARNDDRVLAVSFNEDMFTGGAHGAHALLYHNFRPDTGAAITLEEILVEDGEDSMERLTAVAEEIFRATRELAPDAALDDAGFGFDDGTFALNDNFLIGAEGLVFYYNEYEIAPYAFGPTEVLIPYGSIDNLLRDDVAVR